MTNILSVARLEPPSDLVGGPERKGDGRLVSEGEMPLATAIASNRRRTDVPRVWKYGEEKARPMRRAFSTQHRVIESVTIQSVVLE